MSRAFLEAYKADKLRASLAKDSDVEEIIDFRNYYVFEGVGITTAIVSLDKVERGDNAGVYQLRTPTLIPTSLAEQKTNEAIFEAFSAEQNSFGAESWSFASSEAQTVIDKIDAAGEPVGNVLFIGKGMETGRNNVFGKLTHAQIEGWGLAKEQYYIRARNSDIGRYYIGNSDEYLLYLEDVPHFRHLPEGVQQHLKAHEGKLKARAAYQRGDCEWWRYTWPLHKGYMRRDKLYCPYLATYNRFALDERHQYLGLTDTIVLYDADQPENLCYVMGMLNSKLLTFRFRFIGKLKSSGILEYFWNSVSKLALRRIDFDDSQDVAQHDQMVKLVERMLSLQEKRAEAKLEYERTTTQYQIDAIDRQIDRLVYELYGLADEEIAVVEESVAS